MHFLSALNGLSMSVALTENIIILLGKKKKGKKRKVANFAPGDVRVRMKVDR